MSSPGSERFVPKQGGAVKNRYMRIIVVAGVAAAAVFATSGPAAAVAGLCENNEICLSIDNNNNGHIREFQSNDNSYHDNTWWFRWGNGADTGLSLNDSATSAFSMDQFDDVDICQHASGGIPCDTIPPMGEDQSFSNDALGNDQASSHFFH